MVLLWLVFENHYFPLSDPPNLGTYNFIATFIIFIDRDDVEKVVVMFLGKSIFGAIPIV